MGHKSTCTWHDQKIESFDFKKTHSKLESFIYEHDNINTWFKDFKTFRHFDILPTQIISDLQPILRLFLRRKDTNNLSKFR